MDLTQSLDALGSFRWIVIPLGLFLGLLGYRIYKISLFVIGLIFGLVMSSWIGASIGNNGIGLILGIALGGIIGIVAHFIFRFSLFFAGMTGGFIVATLVLPETDLITNIWDAVIWSGATALAGGVLMLFLYKYFIFLTLSLIGTYMVYAGTKGLLPPETMKWSWLLYVILFVVFLLVQIATRKGHPNPMERGRRQRYRQHW